MDCEALSINLSGQIRSADAPVLTVQNRAFRFGEGLFETMRLSQGRIALADFHFQRLNEGINTLGLDIGVGLNGEKILSEILALCEINGHSASARIRLTAFRDTGIDGRSIQYLIETFPFERQVIANDHGLKLNIYPDGRKAIDSFSNLKSTNFLLYSKAAEFATKRSLDDCLVLNQANRIAETSIANVFCIKDKSIYTPSLSEAPIAGVMRRWLLVQCKFPGYEFIETAIDTAFLNEADEVFLSNALRGIRPVRFFGNKEYSMKTGVRLATIVENLLSGQELIPALVVGKEK